MKKAVVLIGVGEMGGVFAKGFLRAQYPVYPIEQGADIHKAADEIKDPLAVVIAVRENDLQGVLKDIPKKWRDRLILLQNELLPKDWQAYHIANPTVISVWFEKKPGLDAKEIIPSPVFGPRAGLVKDVLGTINLHSKIAASEDEMLFELVVKNLYILTVNIAGLKVGGTVGELWGKHQELARKVSSDILDIQFRLIGRELDRQKLIDRMAEAFEGDLAHQCMGRSAPERLKRTLAFADEFELEVPSLRSIPLPLWEGLGEGKK
ncbi:MAG: hypothetical protein JW847_04230 [Candidatus Omnitrophica bacterium]|nr:hypothetical protein [Candidatus Omnitrophota bacterium]